MQRYPSLIHVLLSRSFKNRHWLVVGYNQLELSWKQYDANFSHICALLILNLELLLMFIVLITVTITVCTWILCVL